MSISHPVCVRYHQAVELIGARWSGAIVRAVQTDQQHFAEIRAAIPGISDTMLAQRLRELEAAGVLMRDADRSGRVGYELTAKGRDLEPVIDALLAWAHRWIPLPTVEAPPVDEELPADQAQPRDEPQRAAR